MGKGQMLNRALRWNWKGFDSKFILRCNRTGMNLERFWSEFADVDIKRARIWEEMDGRDVEWM